MFVVVAWACSLDCFAFPLPPVRSFDLCSLPPWSAVSAAWVRASLATAMRLASSTLASVPPPLRPQITYVSRSRLPRATRQIVLSRLAGQHLAIAGCAAWVRETLSEREDEEDEEELRRTRQGGGGRGSSEAQASAFSPPPLPVLDEHQLLAQLDGAELRERAFAAARAQELELFRPSLTASGYATRTSRATALEWADAGADDVAEEAATRVAGRAKARRRAAARLGKRRREGGENDAQPDARQRTPAPLEAIDLIATAPPDAALPPALTP